MKRVLVIDELEKEFFYYPDYGNLISPETPMDKRTGNKEKRSNCKEIDNTNK